MTKAAAEADRQIGNIVQLARVASIETGRIRARVEIGDLPTKDIPVAQLSSGKIKVHWMPAPGDQVVVFAPGGDLSRAFILGAVPKDDGAVAPDEGTPTIDLGGGTLSIIGDMKVDGTITVTGDVVASGVSLVNHTHPESIGSVTGAPT